jgi:hypothetical protein
MKKCLAVLGAVLGLLLAPIHASANPTILKDYRFSCLATSGSVRCSTDSNANAGTNNLNLPAGDKTILVIGAATTVGSGFSFSSLNVLAYGNAPVPNNIANTLSWHGAAVGYTIQTSAAITGTSGYKCRWSTPGGQVPDAAVCRVIVYSGLITVNPTNFIQTGWGMSGSIILTFTTNADNSDIAFAIPVDDKYGFIPLYGVNPLFTTTNTTRICGAYTDYQHTTIAGNYQVGVSNPSSSNSWAMLAFEVQDH